MYKITKQGQYALINANQLSLSVELTHALQCFENNRLQGSTAMPSIDLEFIQLLADIGFVQRSFVIPAVDLAEPETSDLHQLKQKFVTLLKSNFDNNHKLWDILINLEAVLDKAGLTWFLTKVMEAADPEDVADYLAIYQELEALEHE